MSESSVYVNSAVSADAVRAAVVQLPFPAGVTLVTVDDTATECLGHEVAVDLYGPDADDRDVEFAAALSAELGASVMTGQQLDAALLSGAAHP